jgi:hypothetical protein
MKLAFSNACNRQIRVHYCGKSQDGCLLCGDVSMWARRQFTDQIVSTDGKYYKRAMREGMLGSSCTNIGNEC